jgi:DNA-binding XRE family transcriptional regulator
MNYKHASGVDAEIARRVYAHRNRLGMSQTELAKKLGITFQQVQ